MVNKAELKIADNRSVMDKVQNSKITPYTSVSIKDPATQ